ncbi:MAG: hypothetical protein IKC46_02010 [Lachnospiraceae bacterium]|nr:hypothetical protein [Lachnospiraceae bacterium]
MSVNNSDSSQYVRQATITRCITYDQIRQEPSFPKGRLQFVGWLFRNMWKSLKAGFPKNLLIVLGLGLFYWIFNLIFLGIINDSCFFGNGRFSRSSAIAYLFAGLVYENGAKGFDWIPGGSMTTWFYNLTFFTALFWLVGNIWRRICKEGFLAPMKDIFRIPVNIKTCWNSVTVSFLGKIMLYMGLGILAGFLIKSPFTMVALTIWLLLNFGQGGESSLIYMMFIYQGAVNAKSKKPKALITGADVAVNILGLGLGMLFAFVVSVVLWNTTDYRILSRVLCFLPLGILLVFFGAGGRITMQSRTQKAATIVLLCMGSVWLRTLTAYADDGGWTESGSNIPGWLANPGTQLMEAAGLGGPAGMIAGWLGNMVGNGALDHVTAGLGSAAAGIGAGAQDGGILGAGLGAYESALGGLGPMGNMLSNAWSGAIDALGGGGQGASGSSGSGSWGGSGGSGSGSWGGSGGSGNSGNWGNSGNSGNSGNWGNSGNSGNSGNWNNSGNNGNNGNTNTKPGTGLEEPGTEEDERW